MESFFSIQGVSYNEEQFKKELEQRIAAFSNSSLVNDIKGLRQDFLEISSGEEFLNYYLQVVRNTWLIDINDYEIFRKKGLKGHFELLLKKIIWKLLKFYTYRLFSQQIEFNSQIKNTILALQKDYQKKVSHLESEIEALRR